MKLWLLTQTAERGYDTFDSAIVCAENEEAAKRSHPRESSIYYRDDLRGWFEDYNDRTYRRSGGDWPEDVDAITATEIGIAAEGIEAGVVLSSFNAG